jgi:hypothetical protein
MRWYLVEMPVLRAVFDLAAARGARWAVCMLALGWRPAKQRHGARITAFPA